MEKEESRRVQQHRLHHRHSRAPGASSRSGTPRKRAEFCEGGGTPDMYAKANHRRDKTGGESSSPPTSLGIAEGPLAAVARQQRSLAGLSTQSTGDASSSSSPRAGTEETTVGQNKAGEEREEKREEKKKKKLRGQTEEDWSGSWGCEEEEQQQEEEVLPGEKGAIPRKLSRPFFSEKLVHAKYCRHANTFVYIYITYTYMSIHRYIYEHMRTER